jgi:hypothetical protein
MNFTVYWSSEREKFGIFPLSSSRCAINFNLNLNSEPSGLLLAKFIQKHNVYISPRRRKVSSSSNSIVSLYALNASMTSINCRRLSLILLLLPSVHSELF